ncbi:MAG: DUF3540 domain-containing protein, partial [Myxococcales bacterium]|nr:DUF3540 domain-containing protein [Myxococcales bacterium]
MHAPKLDNVTPLPAAPYQGLATITREHPDGGLWIEGEPSAGPREGLVARRAASCLLEPAVGDRVWVVGQG